MAERRHWWWLSLLCAVGFVAAGVTYLLIVLGVVGSPEPTFEGDVDGYLTQYLRYRQSIMPAEVVANVSVVIAAIAFAVLMWIGPLFGVLRTDPLGNVSSALAFSGAMLFAATQLAYLGALGSVLEASSTGAFDVPDLATLTQVIDRTDDYLENLGMLLIAAALPGARMTSSGLLPTWWRWSTTVLALALVLVVIASFTGVEWGNLLLAATALALVPTVALVLGGRLRQSS